MSFPGFHRIVSSWFTDCVGVPTVAQQRGWAAIHEGRHALIAAPTGSGKTLAAFLTALDALVQESVAGRLPDEVRVVYVSPLKALSADIHKNLAEPRAGIRQYAEREGLSVAEITAAVRTGDTTQSERAAILRTPPHILVTTPESLYLLLTAERSRQMLRTVRTVIVDEIHAVIGTRRGAHLALSLERLQHVAAQPVQRIGLSATQKPVEDVARFLVGDRDAGCAIVDEGHRRTLDLALEIPGSPLEAVMAHEVWEEYYERLTQLILEHKTTLVFVNTRRMAERLARDLSERLGDEAVTAHHGSLAKEIRLDAEHRLKTGALKALVATASLELGIDIGHVDLVCQIGSPHRIATLLQRVGRSGHSIDGTPKGRLMPVSRDDLVECAALLRAVRAGELDRIVVHDAPLDVLAQQMAAEVSCCEHGEDSLFDLVRRAWPYRGLSRDDFNGVVAMVSEGFATRRGRRAALVHRDEVHRVVRGRRGTRMLAMTAGGAIPEVADYRVVLEPGDTFIGSLNEDFAIESMAGDVFQLGNASWRVVQVAAGTVRVSDAQGAPPNIPFWFGEAPARSDELSRAVSDLRGEFEKQLVEPKADPTSDADATTDTGSVTSDLGAFGRPIDWLIAETGIDTGSAEQIAAYFTDGHQALGVIPTQRTLVLERFFDESGGMQLVLHAPFGSRINRAWALALRKRFCRQFNFELQAAATEDALLLSLGEQHSFPLADVFRYLHPASVREILVQAFLDAPVFQTRWRWNATISLAVPRSRGGKKVAPQLQRMQADDLMAAVFPDAAACLENIPGDREIPNHPLVSQTVRDCLEEAMDLPGLLTVLEQIHRGELRCVSRDTPEPSVFAHEILNARPYAFLDDAPLEERRAHAVQTRRAGDPADAHGVLDADAIARVRQEVRPDPRDADELHDALLTCGFLLDGEVVQTDALSLAASSRATMAFTPSSAARPAARLWIAAERLPELLAVRPDVTLDPAITTPPSRAARIWTHLDALAELLRGRLPVVGPTTAADLAESIGIATTDVDEALLVLESDGAVLRGNFTPGPRHDTGPTESPVRSVPQGARANVEWCDRRILARIHRYTLNRLRAEIAPVSAADFQRFLFAWQHVDPLHALTGADGLRAVIAQLDGLELPARAWERDVLPRRVHDYGSALLDMLCLTGEVSWARVSSGPTQLVGATPVALFLREHLDAWYSLRGTASYPVPELSSVAASVLAHLSTRGATFFHELRVACDLSDDDLRSALAELVAVGSVSSDGFAGLRAIVGGTSNLAERGVRPEAAGRWFVIAASDHPQEGAVEMLAWTLLRRYGVVFRRLLYRETSVVPWRDLVRVYRRLEARGEIRGGRFVTGMSGEQFALADAVDRLREVRRSSRDDRLVTISGADPLNLTGIITDGDRIRTSASARIVYRNGVALAAMEGDMLRTLAPLEPADAANVAAAAAGRRVPVIRGYVGRAR
jgi:ATP-dependent helicase Lhr and Lhr-like helicase